MQSRENFAKYIEPLADKLGAGVGASRAAVDAGVGEPALRADHQPSRNPGAQIARVAAQHGAIRDRPGLVEIAAGELAFARLIADRGQQRLR